MMDDRRRSGPAWERQPTIAWACVNGRVGRGCIGGTIALQQRRPLRDGARVGGGPTGPPPDRARAAMGHDEARCFRVFDDGGAAVLRSASNVPFGMAMRQGVAARASCPRSTRGARPFDGIGANRPSAIGLAHGDSPLTNAQPSGPTPVHELSIAQSVVGTVEQVRADRSLGPVTTVRLRIGRMSGVSPDSLHFCWGLATEKTDLAGSELDIIMTEPCYRCTQCDATADFETAPDSCPSCGARALQLDGGADLTIDSLEIREDDAP